jgi:uncharacterized integral membrane protein
MKAKHIIILIIFLLVLILILQNLAVTTLNIFFWELRLPRTILILTVLLLGFLAGYIVRSLQSGNKMKKKAESQKNTT